MILQVRSTFWWSLKFKKLNSFIILWNKVVRRNFNFVTWKIKMLIKLVTGHSRDYVVTIGSLGYLKLVESDMYPKFLKINFVVVVRHSACIWLWFDWITLEDISRVLDGLPLRLPHVVIVEDDGAVEKVERLPEVAILVTQPDDGVEKFLKQLLRAIFRKCCFIPYSW